MAFRGRGRGRGYGGRGYGGRGYGKKEPYELFPDVELPDKNGVSLEKTLIGYNIRLQKFWKFSAYYIEETEQKNLATVWRIGDHDCDICQAKGLSKRCALIFYATRCMNWLHLAESQYTDIARFSDRTKPKTKFRRDDLWEFMKRNTLSFPLELINSGKGKGVSVRPQKKARWNPEAQSDKKWDLLEKLEQRYQDKSEEGEKEGQSEDEDNVESEESEEYSDDGDYNQNKDFDDDEDDYNMPDDDGDEPTYE